MIIIYGVHFMNVLLLTNDYTLAQSTAKCLDKEGHRLIGIGSHSSRGIALLKVCDLFYEVDEALFSYGHELVTIIQAFSRAHACQVLLPVDSKSIMFVSRNKNALQESISIAPISNHDLIQQLDNKWTFYQLLQKLKQPTPATILIKNKDSHPAINFTFPALTKPLQQTGGAGIIYHQSYPDFAEKINSFQLPVILQEYIPGRDIDCSVFAVNGEIKAWTIQEHKGIGLEFCHNDEILAVCRDILQPVRYSGVAHFDLRVGAGDHEIKMLECNPRFWATVDSSMEAGVNFPQLVLRSACREELSGVAAIADDVCFIPTKKKKLFKAVLLSLTDRKRNKAYSDSYSKYLRQNLAAEIFRILEVKNKVLAGRWFNLCLKSGYGGKYRIIEKLTQHPIGFGQ